MRFSTVLACILAALSPAAAVAGTLTTIATLPSHTDGAAPAAALVAVGGKYYGTTAGGGTGQSGTIFQLDPQTGQETTLYNFSVASGDFPSTPLVAFNGKLYGTTAGGGGSANAGVVFSFDPASNTETVLYTFSNTFEQNKSGLTEFGGLLYGVVEQGGPGGNGYIYDIDPATGAETAVYSFADQSQGLDPTGGLVAYQGVLYGLAGAGGSMNGGTLFRFDPASDKLAALYSFDTQNEIASSVAGLTQAGGVFYGTTVFGGSNAAGTVFAFDTQKSQFSVIYTFKGGADGGNPEAGLLAANGLLYGTTVSNGASSLGTVFSVDPATGTETTLHSFAGPDGYTPQAALIQAGTVLLGTTNGGGRAEDGVAFSIDPSSDQETTLHVFIGSKLSSNSALIGFGGALYGTSTNGGSSNIGSVFKVDPHTGAEKTLYSFMGGTDGSQPATALLNVGGVFYGATSSGGANNNGTLFRFDPSTGAETTVFNFDYQTSGSFPGSLATVSGILYGTTSVGGGGYGGTLFAFDPAAGTLTKLHVFSQEADGWNPASGVVAVNGTLFGTAPYGGDKDMGAVFSYVLSSGTFTTVHTFQGGADGAFPYNGLVYANGALFGSTGGFKKKDAATIFKIDPVAGTETVLHTLPKPEQSSAMVAAGSFLFGTVLDGPYQYGSIFRFDPAAGDFHTLYDFKGGSDGGNPDAALLDIGGHLYGTTKATTTGNGGTVFRYDR